MKLGWFIVEISPESLKERRFGNLPSLMLSVTPSR
jgi:hypothetical protein